MNLSATASLPGAALPIARAISVPASSSGHASRTATGAPPSGSAPEDPLTYPTMSSSVGEQLWWLHAGERLGRAARMLLDGRGS